MARGNQIKVLRSTRANLDAQRAANGLIAGEPYLITDEGRLAVATAVNAYVDFARLSELTSANIGATATNDNAAAGRLGEFASNSLSLGSATSLTSAVAKTITSLTLAAGDWDVSGIFGVVGLTSLTIGSQIASISTTDNTLDSTPPRMAALNATQSIGTSSSLMPVGPARFSLASSTTLYLVGRCSIVSGTAGGFGAIQARRAR